MLDLITQLRFRDLVDVILMAFLLYTIIVWAKRARVGRILSGLGTLALIYIIARLLELQLTVWVFQGLFAVLGIILIVIFQSELRQIFERLSTWNFRNGDDVYPEKETSEPLIGAVSKLASSSIGALIVMVGREAIDPHIAGGIAVDAIVSAPFIESIFDPHSPGHDGALVLNGNRASHFAGHLPLSTDFDQLKGRGTRHAAALGLSERTDALCIVVSEERGLISIAQNGRIEELQGAPELASRLDEFLKEKAVESTSESRRRILSFRRHWPEKAVAFAVALFAWVAFVSDFGTEDRIISVPVVIENVSAELRVAEVEPQQVSIVFRASRQNFNGLDTGQLGMTLNAAQLAAGEHVLQTRTEDVRFPGGLEIVDIDPGLVRLVLIQSTGGD